MALRAANRDVPDAALPLFARFQTLLDREDRVGAKGALEEAVSLAPQSSTLLTTLAQVEEQVGDYDAAIARYRRIVRIDPANVVALNNLAFALAVRRQAPTEALPFARRAASLASSSGGVLDTLGWVEHLAGNDSVATSILEQAVQLDPGQAEIRLHLATVYSEVGKIDRAEAELTRARLDASLEGLDEVGIIRARIAQSKPKK